MKIKTSELSGSALDWAVAMAEGLKPEDIYIPWSSPQASLCRRLRDEDGKLNGRYQTGPDLLFHRKWEAAGPIIAREGISILCSNRSTNNEWQATYNNPWIKGPTPLVAAMRCYATRRLGDEVEVPDELIKE